MPRRLIKLFSYKNDIVLDPFNGAGTTTLVSWKLHRRFIGIDASKQYCDTAMQRLAAAEENGVVCSSDYPKPSVMILDE
jgi:DNA modification methylase